MRPAAARAVWLLALAVAAPLGATAGPWIETDQTRVRLVSSTTSVGAGGDPGLGIEFALAPGWHVYWKNAGDAGYPPQLELPEGTPLESAVLRFPAPHRFDLPGDLVAFGYEGEVLYPVDARLREELAPGPLEIRLSLDYLVCAESCIPYRTELTLPLEIGEPGTDESTAARIASWRDRLPVPAGAAETPSAGTRLELVSEDGGMELVVKLGGEGVTVSSPDLFFEPHQQVSFGPPRYVATATGPVFRVPIAPLDRTRPLPDPLAVAWTATGLTSASGAALAVEDRVEVALPAEAGTGGVPRILRRAAIVAIGVLFVFLLLRRFGNRRPDPSTSD